MAMTIKDFKDIIGSLPKKTEVRIVQVDGDNVTSYGVERGMVFDPTEKVLYFRVDFEDEDDITDLDQE